MRLTVSAGGFGAERLSEARSLPFEVAVVGTGITSELFEFYDVKDFEGSGNALGYLRATKKEVRVSVIDCHRLFRLIPESIAGQ